MSRQTVGPVHAHGFIFDVAGGTEQGPRDENQDAYLVAGFERTGVVAVADGMGGEQGGKLAAETAIRSLAEGGALASLDAARYAIRAADEAVAKAATGADGERKRMGCALALVGLATDRAGQVGLVGAHVGDVRILSRAPDGTVRLETRDHTPAFAKWEAGEISLDEIPDSPLSNRLQRAVGHGGDADTTWLPVRAGWTYLLISDGVTKATRLEELGQALALPSAEASCAAILRKVEERGADDNFTAVVMRILGDGADPNATLGNPPPRAAETAAPAAAAAHPHHEDDVTPRRSPLAGLATLLSLLGLALAGFALWTAMQAQQADRARAQELAGLRGTVDSLRTAARPDSAATAAGAPRGDTLRATAPRDTAQPSVAPPVPLTARPGAAGARP
ncbi:MAG TPA: protein phosphatase 2C domain-containing protein [Longimicrobiaceae bacterium]|nr:protein phosphatase 2C domain-containing protein [Longimicrobiaceae bacterium]